MNNLNKIKPYLIVSAVTLIAVVMYLFCFGFEISKPISLDTDKPMEKFISTFVENEECISSNIFEVCDYNIQYFIMYAIGNVFGDIWIGINIIYILSFFLISVTMYWYLQKLSVSKFVSVAISVIVAFLPFHVNRGQGQILTSNFFVVPLFMGILYEMIYAKEHHSINKLYFILMCLTPFLDIRISIMMIVLFVILIVHRCDFSVLKKSLWYLCPLTVLTILSGKFTTVLKMTNLQDSIELSKSEGLRILDMIMPIRYHIIRRLSDFRVKYDVEFSASGESGLNTMGVLISVGFVVGMFALFYGKKVDRRIIWLSWINIIVIIISNIHGLNLIFEYLGIHVIYWNRMGIFVLIGSAAITAMLADSLKKLLDKIFGTCLTLIGMMVVFVVAFLELLLRQNMSI